MVFHNWIEVRRELYLMLRNAVTAIEGDESADLKIYRKAYEREANGKWELSDKDLLLHSIQAAKLVLLGDFHALMQSQRTQLRVLKMIHQNQGRKRPMYVALECVSSKYQKVLDQFMKSSISEKEFLAKVRWEKDWGFPWVHYKPIFEWAKKTKTPIYAINSDKKGYGLQSLNARDAFAAAKVREILKQQPPEALGVIIYGDLHIAEPHLPRQLREICGLRKRDYVKIFQNSEKIFFELLAKHKSSDADLVSYSPNNFCLLSVPPWVKWQNYLVFLEQHYDSSLSDERDEIDYTDHVAKYVKLLSKDLSLKIGIEQIAVYSPESESAVDILLNSNLSNKDKKWWIREMENNISFFVPEISFAYLARPTINHTANLAMMILIASVHDLKKWPEVTEQNFLLNIWLEALQYFGSKLVNPKRKTDTMVDIKNQLAVRGGSDRGRQALILALKQKMQEMLYLSGQTQVTFKVEEKIKASTLAEVSRILGGMLGEKLFAGFQAKLLSSKSITSLLKKPIHDSKSFVPVYKSILELVDSLPESFLTKTEKL